MERVTFLIEERGERVSCLLNPESLTITRHAGLHERVGRGGFGNVDILGHAVFRRFDRRRKTA